MSVDRDEGQPLRKKVSSSLIEPTLLGYQHAFTRNATEIGWLDITKGDSSKDRGGERQWQRRWFELKDGVIRHAPSNSEEDRKESVFIPIENIIRLVTDNKKKKRRQLLATGTAGTDTDNGSTLEHLITMKTTHEKLILRAESSDDLNRWVFAFQRSVALAMTKIMMAQANSSMHHSLGTSDATLRQHDAEEVLFLQEAAVNEDDGWDTRRLTRTRNIMDGHANVINTAKGGAGGGGGGGNWANTKPSRSMSICSQQEMESQQAAAAAASLRVRTYKDRSFGDLTKAQDESHEPPGAMSSPSSPLRISWGRGQPQTEYSSEDSSPRVGPGDTALSVIPGNRTTSSSSTGSGSGFGLLGHSTESMNDTWRSVDDMSAILDGGMGGTCSSSGVMEDYKEKMSPNSYSVGRTRSISVGSCGSGSGGGSRRGSGTGLGRDCPLAPLDLSPSGKSTYSGSTGSGSGSLHGENISTSTPNSPSRESPYRERSASNVSGNGGCRVVGRISEGSSGDNSGGGGGYMFGMDDVDSLENSLEDFSAFGDLSAGGRGGCHGILQSQSESPLSSYLTKPSSLRVEYGACTKLGPKTNQEDRFVMIPTLTSPLGTDQEVEGYDNESNTYRCDNSYAAVYDGHCGSKASTFVNDTLHNMIFQHPFYDYDIELAIRECAENIDRTFLERARREDIYDGTTAIGAFFHPKSSQRPDTCSVKVEFPSSEGEGNGGGGADGGVPDQLTRQYSIADPNGLNQQMYGGGHHQHYNQHQYQHPQHHSGIGAMTGIGGDTKPSVVRETDMRMTVFNIGDSRAVLCRNGVAICMSEAHCPSRPDEQLRVEAAKGWITEEKELFVGRLHRMDLSDPDIADQAANGIQWTTIYRVLGEVSVSRSIGDYPYKGFVPGEVVTDFFSWPEGHDMIFNADLVISVPESKHVDIDELCEFVILASDGLWDVVSNEKAVARVKAAFERGESPKTAAEELCGLALKLGSGDNTTVIVVQFFHNMKGL